MKENSRFFLACMTQSQDMEEVLYDKVPSLDLADFLSGNARTKKEFVARLGEAYSNIGFVAVRNHFLKEELRQRLYEIIRDFFSLPDEVKTKYEVSGLAGQRGYTSKGKEHAKGRSTGDLKEFYHIGQEPAGGGSFPGYPENIWPEEIPGFREVSLEAFRALEKTGMSMLGAIALYLGLEETFFDEKVSQGNSILRPIHYYPITNPEAAPEGAVRAAEHGDINLITLLMGASAEGLEVLRRDGKWIAITALPEQLVVNVGDMLERLTNGRLRSTVHRVVNPPREQMHMPRYSIPFFMHPQSEMSLSCLDECVDAHHPKLFDDITAGEFLDQRLAEIGLKK